MPVPAAKARPRVSTTLWEDENTLCFQVEARGISVARREDNDMINGTKLLNVAGMTRGRRDGMLKAEKDRRVVKIGAMHLKGVWIPFDRAVSFAQKEGIADLLYPLFVDDIRSYMYRQTNPSGAEIPLILPNDTKQYTMSASNTASPLPAEHKLAGGRRDDPSAQGHGMSAQHTPQQQTPQQAQQQTQQYSRQQYGTAPYMPAQYAGVQNYGAPINNNGYAYQYQNYPQMLYANQEYSQQPMYYQQGYQQGYDQYHQQQQQYYSKPPQKEDPK